MYRVSVQNAVFSISTLQETYYENNSYTLDIEMYVLDRLSLSTGITYNNFSTDVFRARFPTLETTKWQIESSQIYEIPIFINFRENVDYDGMVIFSLGAGYVVTMMNNHEYSFGSKSQIDGSVEKRTDKRGTDQPYAYFALKFEPGIQISDFSFRIGLTANFIPKRKYLHKKGYRHNMYYKLGYDF